MMKLIERNLFRSIKKDENNVSLAHNADIILMGYRETIGTGTRTSR